MCSGCRSASGSSSATRKKWDGARLPSRVSWPCRRVTTRAWSVRSSRRSCQWRCVAKPKRPTRPRAARRRRKPPPPRNARMSKGHRKSAHAAEHGNGERWLLTYADLITLLMVFFVVLYSMSSADTTKFKLISAALQQAFNLDVLQGQSAAALSDGATQMSPPLDTMIGPSDVPQVAQIRNKIQGVLDGATQVPEVTVGVDI